MRKQYTYFVKSVYKCIALFSNKDFAKKCRSCWIILVNNESRFKRKFRAITLYDRPPSWKYANVEENHAMKLSTRHKLMNKMANVDMYTSFVDPAVSVDENVYSEGVNYA
jgi:hypothetical protein